MTLQERLDVAGAEQVRVTDLRHRAFEAADRATIELARIDGMIAVLTELLIASQATTSEGS